MTEHRPFESGSADKPWERVKLSTVLVLEFFDYLDIASRYRGVTIVMDDSSSKPALTADELFRVRQRLEDLTKSYVDGLLSSNAAAESYVKWLTSIVEAVGDGLLVFDENQELVLANQAALKFAGWDVIHLPRNEFRSKYQFSIDGGKSYIAGDEEPLAVAMREKRSVEMEGIITGHLLPAEGVWVRVHAAPIIGKGGEALGGVTVFHDITERKRLQRQRDALATLITHDLKNHLASEQWFFDLLEEGYSGRFDSDEMMLLSELRKSNQRYFDIARTLLEIHRVDLLESGFSPVDISFNELLRSVVDLNSQVASLRGVQLMLTVSQDTPRVKGIATALHQVFHNLVQNAINASAPDQSVEINARKAATGVVVEVVDHGPGMPEQEVEHLFQASAGGSRLPTSTISSRFGLYLCRLLIEEHGGKISCKSILGCGTTLSVDVPLENPRCIVAPGLNAAEQLS